jgi:AAA+ superfamily predicted ATPase
MLASTYRKQRVLLNTLRFLATDLRISRVYAGTHDAKRALTTDPQLADRFEAIEPPALKNNESRHRLLTSFQSLLPLRVRSDLVAAAMRRALLNRTEGITVRLVRLIETLTVNAIRNHAEKIDATILHRLSSPPLLSMTKSHSASDTSP